MKSYVFALFTLAILIAAQSSLAQGTSGTLPDPISSRELLNYAARLKLSDQQIKAIEPLHDQYKQEFRSLRDGEIAAFLKEMRSIQGTMPKREAMEDFMKRMDQLTTKIAAIDSRLFDQMQAILTPEQLAFVPRVRQARQRARYAASQMMMISGRRTVDLSQIMLEIELNPDQFQIADPLMSQYEGKLTSSMGKLYETSTTMIMDMFNAFEQQGFTEESMNDPEAAEKLGEVMQTIWRDLTKKALEAAADISDLNRRTYKSVASVLEPQTARTLREKFYRQAYPELGFAFHNDEASFQYALKLEELTEEQRQAITLAQDDVRRKMDALLEDAVELIDQNQRNFSPFDYDSQSMQEYQQKIASFQEKANQIRQGGSETLNATLGPELAKKVTGHALAAAEKDQKELSSQVAAAEQALGATEKNHDDEHDGDEAELPGQDVQQSADQFLPGRIGTSELAGYGERLHLTEDQRSIIQQLHQSYIEQFQLIQDNQIAALQKTVQAMWSVDDQSHTVKGLTLEKIEDAYRLRREAMEAIRRTDTAFFDEIELGVLTPEQTPLMNRVRLARERAGYNRQQHHWGYYFGGGGSNESGIDVADLVQRQRLDEPALKSVEATLIAYEEAATAAFRAKYEAALDMQRTQERWQAEVTQAQAEGETNPMKFAQKYQEIMGEAVKRTTQANAELGKLNREHIERVIAALPADAAYNLRSEYNRAAFPNIYNDATAVDRQLNEALKLGDLTDGQSRQISDLAAEYRPAYAGFCEQMVEISAGSDDTNIMSGDPDAWKKFQERHDAISKIKFDRNELNTRAISQLKTTLSEDQIQRIGGLPVPKPPSEMDMWE